MSRAAIILDLRALQSHPRCFYPITDKATGLKSLRGLAGVDRNRHESRRHRTWLDPSVRDKPPISSPRRALGDLFGHGVRFGTANDVMAAGEGLEAVLSVRTLLPAMPMAAAPSA